LSDANSVHKRELPVRLANKLICNFITDKFLSPPKDRDGNEISQNQYALDLGISSSVLTKMKRDEGYDIPFSTIYIICEREKISVSKLFILIEKEFSDFKFD